MIAAGLIGAPAPPTGSPSDPFAMLADSGGPLFLLALLLPAAVFVFWFGSRRFSKERGSSALRPRGRVLFDHGRRRSDRWRATVKRLEAGSVTATADAKAGPVRLEGVLVNASGDLGGPEGRRCVWRNRAGGRPASAVGAEMVILQDDAGACGIEGIERAFIIAPTEKHTFHHENVSLYLGDRVEVFGDFTPEAADTDADADPSQRVYGTLSFADGLDVRLVERSPAAADPSSSNASLDAP